MSVISMSVATRTKRSGLGLHEYFILCSYGVVILMLVFISTSAGQTGGHGEMKGSRPRVQPELPVPRFRRRERRKAGTRGTEYLTGMRAVSLGLDEKAGDAAKSGAKKETSSTKDVGWKLREALKQQLAIIHERVEAKKLAKLALAEVRQLLAKEEEEKELELGRKEIRAQVRERVVARLQEEEEKMEKEEIEKALEKLRKERAKHLDEKEEKEEKQSRKGAVEKKVEGERKRARKEDEERGKESAKEKRKKDEKFDRRGRK